MSTKITQDTRKIYRKALSAFGIEDFDFVWRGKHPALVFELKGKEHRIVMAGSPSDHRARMNNISFLKRYIRSLDEQHTLH